MFKPRTKCSICIYMSSARDTNLSFDMPACTRPQQHTFNKGDSIYSLVISAGRIYPVAANKFLLLPPPPPPHYNHPLTLHNEPAHHSYYQHRSDNVSGSENNNTSDHAIEDEDDEDFDDEGNGQGPMCGECGRPLGPGWVCVSCRRNCPHCNRALTLEPDDYCERCFRKCPSHNLIYSVILNAHCPACVEKTIRKKS